jgi:release factor glutamine methyltransferase
MQVAKKLIYDNLSPIYCRQEIEGITKLIFEKVLGLTRLQVHLNQHKILTSANLTQITEIVNRLLQFEPIQYILGETEFYGLPIKVNSGVLIPRPETEELVDWIINDCHYENPVILDIGTGSGCIPIALSKNLTAASTVAWDISPDALMVARENAKINKVKINFVCVDILKMKYPVQKQKYDIIVSNPPYVTVSEKGAMLKNVVDFEPHIALFVADKDPLIFYRTIAELATDLLKPSGKLYFEINEQFGNETVDLLSLKRFKNIILRKDINGKERMLKAEWDNYTI